MERFANKAFTTLVDAIDDSTDPVTFEVANPAAFPTDGNFRVIIDSEILLVTGVSGSDFTASRGAEGSPITQHYPGVGVRHIFTAGALTQTLAENITTGTYANLPSSPERLGQLYVPTDDNVILVSDGSNWLAYGPTYPIVRPTLSDFTTFNTGDGLTVTQTAWGVNFAQVNGGGGRRGMYRTAIAPPFKITCIFTHQTFPIDDDRACGLLQRESSSDKLITFEKAILFARVGVHQWNTSTSFNGSPFAWTLTDSTAAWLSFLQIHDDGTDVHYNYSPDGIHWITLYSRGRTSFLTADEYGFCLSESSSTANLLSFKAESIEVATSGGVVAAGTTVVQKNTTLLGSGGSVAAGTSTVSQPSSYTGSGGSVAAGDGIASTTIVANGGVVTAGEGNNSELSFLTATGGGVAAGSGTISKQSFLAATGGAVVGGAAIDDVDTGGGGGFEEVEGFIFEQSDSSDFLYDWQPFTSDRVIYLEISWDGETWDFFSWIDHTEDGPYFQTANVLDGWPEAGTDFVPGNTYYMRVRYQDQYPDPTVTGDFVELSFVAV